MRTSARVGRGARRAAGRSARFSRLSCRAATIRAVFDSGAWNSGRGLAQVRLHRAGQLGQQHLAGLQVGELADLGGRDRLALEDAALDHQQRVGLRELAQALRRLDGVAGDEGERGRTGEQLVEPRDARVRRGALGQRVLRDRVRGAPAERAPQLR